MAMTTGDGRARVPVWDLGVRLFHWSLVASVGLAWIMVDPRWLHRRFGYTVAALIAFRLVWGVIGGRHARFTDFVPAPTTVLRYLRDIVRGREARHLGHNPAGGAMILALLALLAGICTTGVMMGMDAYFGQDWVEATHKTLVDGLILLVLLHLGGVALASVRHRENLVRAMVDGHKDADTSHAGPSGTARQA